MLSRILGVIIGLVITIGIAYTVCGAERIPTEAWVELCNDKSLVSIDVVYQYKDTKVTKTFYCVN